MRSRSLQCCRRACLHDASAVGARLSRAAGALPRLTMKGRLRFRPGEAEQALELALALLEGPSRWRPVAL